MASHKAALHVQADRVLHRLTETMIGANFEDLNYQTMGGLYSQLIHGENFEEPGRGAVSGQWRPLGTGSAVAAFALETAGTFNGTTSQRITFESGRGEVGIDNAGLNRWGLLVRKGRPYEGLLRVQSTRAGSLRVSLRDASGAKVYATRTVRLKGSRAWQEVEFTLTPNQTDRDGRFAITLSSPGSIRVGYAFLQPGPWARLNDLPVRKDLARAIVDQGVKIIRYNGSMITTPDRTDYQWKKMRGPRDQRPPFTGTFNPYASHGWGIFEFLQFCEATDIVAVPGLNTSETPQDLADFVEYVNGPATSRYGRLRAADGHPEPYHVKYLQYGNEEHIEEAYYRSFKSAASAIWAKDPEMTIVISDWMYWQGISDPRNITRATCTTLDAHVKILEFARDCGGKLWWDVHVWENGPRACAVNGLRDLNRWFRKLVPDYHCPIVALEWNAGNHDMQRALGHACMSNELARMGKIVPAGAAPNTLQAWKQYTTPSWDQGQITFTQDKVWYQGGAYVDIMLSRADCPDIVKTSPCRHKDPLNFTARRSSDGKRLCLCAANVTEQPVRASIRIDGFSPNRKSAAVVELSGPMKAKNTLESPTTITPAYRTLRSALRKGRMTYTFPPSSFTIIEFA